jgi:hypothetical protein
MQLAAHWGTFIKSTNPAPNVTSAQLCLQFAESALRRVGFQIFDPADQSGDFSVLGRTPDAEIIVHVVCVPLAGPNTWVTVSAFANSSVAAEQMRNLIRTDIIGAH